MIEHRGIYCFPEEATYNSAEYILWEIIARAG